MIDRNDTTAWWKNFPGRMIAEMIPTARTTHPVGLWIMHVHSLPPLVRPRAIPSDGVVNCYAFCHINLWRDRIDRIDFVLLTFDGSKYL